MKKLIIIIVLLYCTTKVNAQFGNNIHYDTCALLQQHAGEWRYINGNDTIKFFFKLHRSKSVTLNFIMDGLWGFIEYKHGNNIVYSNYQNRFNTLPYIIDSFPLDQKNINIGTGICSPFSVNTLYGRLIYPMNGFQSYDVKALINSAGTEMTWHQDFHFTYHNSVTIPDNPPTGLNKMPDDFVLIKQP